MEPSIPEKHIETTISPNPNPFTNLSLLYALITAPMIAVINATVMMFLRDNILDSYYLNEA